MECVQHKGHAGTGEVRFGPSHSWMFIRKYIKDNILVHIHSAKGIWGERSMTQI